MVFTIAIPVLFLGGLAITALIIFLKNLRSEEARSIPWRRLSLWALWGLAAYVVVFALGNRIPAFLGAYNTANPFKVMLGTLADRRDSWRTVLFRVIWPGVRHRVVFREAGVRGRKFPELDGYARVLLTAMRCSSALGGAGALIGLQTLLQTISQHLADGASFHGSFRLDRTTTRSFRPMQF